MACTLYKTKGLKHSAVLHNIGINWVGRGDGATGANAPPKSSLPKTFFG